MAQLRYNLNLLLSIFVSYLVIDAQGIPLEVSSDGPNKYWVGGLQLAGHKGGRHSPRTCRTVLMNRDLLIHFAASAEHPIFSSLLLIAPLKFTIHEASLRPALCQASCISMSISSWTLRRQCREDVHQPKITSDSALFLWFAIKTSERYHDSVYLKGYQDRATATITKDSIQNTPATPTLCHRQRRQHPLNNNYPSTYKITIPSPRCLLMKWPPGSRHSLKNQLPQTNQAT